MMNQLSIEDLARNACLEVGIEYKPVPADGAFHPTKLLDSNKKGNGRIKLFSDLQGGVAFNWVTGQSQNFFINQANGLPVSEQDREKAKVEQQRRQAEQSARQNKAALKAQSIWTNAKPAPADHPYLIKKGIKPHHARQVDWEKWVLAENDQWKKIVIKNVLLIPLFNANGVIRNLQAIFPEIRLELERNKDFLPKAELSGLFSWVGDKTDTVCIAEGVATAFTIYEETGFRCYIAFTANNLLSVAKTIRKNLIKTKIILCADNDKTQGNPGLSKANEAAQVVGGLVAYPPIRGMDFNDYHLSLRGAV